jgi:toxin CptA
VLQVRLGNSWLLAAILIFAHAAITLIAFFVDIDLWMRAVAVTAIAGSAAWQIRQSALRCGSRSVIGLHVGRDDALTIETRGGEKLGCEVLSSTFVSALMTVVNLRADPERGLLHAVIFPDCVNADDFRRLRVWLRWKALSASPVNRPTSRMETTTAPRCKEQE